MPRRLVVSSTFPRLFLPSLTALLLPFLLAVCLSFVFQNWPEGFIRPGEASIYFGVYFVVLWIVLVLMSSAQKLSSVKQQIIFGGIVGQILSMVAVLITAQLATPDFFEKWSNGIEQMNIVYMLAAVIGVSFFRAIFLGGWLFGVMAFLSMGIASDKLKSV